MTKPFGEMTHDEALSFALLAATFSEILIKWMDEQSDNEYVKYVVLLAVGHTQRQFMLEEGGDLARAVPRIEEFHRKTVEELGE